MKFRLDDGYLMKRSEIQEFIKHQELITKLVTDNKPKCADFSYDKVAGDILQRLDNESDHEYCVRKSLALLLRKDEGETKEEIQGRDLMQNWNQSK